MVCALGFLLVLIRHIERWLHQHIFKVGWLLTNNYQTTTILYYLLFLPGILLHEFTVWLIAGLLNVRAERAIGFPEQQEIGELRLNFVRVSPQAGGIRSALIRIAPLLAGMIALWVIAAHVFRWQELANLSPAGSIDELARAVTRLTGTTDFWLWFYLAFTVANTMFPSLSAQLSARRKSALALALSALVLFAWLGGGAIEISIAEGIEVLLGSLILVVLQVIVINIAVVLGLGALEALIERLSGKSATFADGKMITRSRQETQAQKGARARKSRESRQQQPASARTDVIRSVYALKLPIPGPPGREPVSRRAVTVVNVPGGDTIAAPPVASIEAKRDSPTQSTVSVKQSSPDRDETGERKTARRAKMNTQERAPVVRAPSANDETEADAKGDERAPFSRPFANASSVRQADESLMDDADEQVSDGFFPRPFLIKTDANGEPDVVDPKPPSSDLESSGDVAGDGSDRRPRA